MRVPARLARDPIIEAVVEIRFVADAAASELLPGLLVSNVQSLGRPVRLPMADFPREMQQVAENLRYLPRLSLQGDGFSVLVGDRSLIVSCHRPYLGWTKFRPIVLNVLGALQKTDVVKQVERIAVKYVNVLEAPDNSNQQFQLIRFEAKLGDVDLRETFTTHVHTERVDEGTSDLIDVKARSSAKTPSGEVVNGLLVSVDTVCTHVDEFWDRKEQILQDVHTRAKVAFFSVLTEATIASFDPTWE